MAQEQARAGAASRGVAANATTSTVIDLESHLIHSLIV
jgi:hypothetical protein